MAVRWLQFLILLLAASGLVEVGYLWGTFRVRREPKIIFWPEAPAPIAEIAPRALPPDAEPPAPTPPRQALSRPPGRRSAPGGGQTGAMNSREVADCARSGGPLCGMPP